MLPRSPTSQGPLMEEGTRTPLILIVGLTAIMASGASATGNGVKGAYWPSWTASYRPPSKINAALYTHLFYAFAHLDPHTFEIHVAPGEEKTAAGFTPTVLASNPRVKTLLSIGGGGANQTTFAAMASGDSRRGAFINSSIALARRHGFHGLDLDWEFPQNRAEMENLGKLFSEWKCSIHAESRASGRAPLLLTAAVYFSQYFFLWGEPRAYPAAAIAENLDWVNVMCFDFHGPWDATRTGAPAALYDPASNVSASFGIATWLDSGVPRWKVVLGLPLYGHSWTLRSADEVGIGAPALGAGPTQKVSNESGAILFFEIVDFVRRRNATVVFDEATVSAYGYAGDFWVGYDNEESVARKLEFAKGRGLLGYFFWAVSFDHRWVISSKASKTWDK